MSLKWDLTHKGHNEYYVLFPVIIINMFKIKTNTANNDDKNVSK